MADSSESTCKNGSGFAERFHGCTLSVVLLGFRTRLGNPRQLERGPYKVLIWVRYREPFSSTTLEVQARSPCVKVHGLLGINQCKSLGSFG